MQFTDVIQQEICRNFYSDDEKAKIQMLLECLEDGSPTLLCFHGYFFGYAWGGHAVVAYDGKVFIYDNNRVDYDDEFCLYFNSDIGAWTIPYYYLDSEYGSLLGMITDDLSNTEINATNRVYYAKLKFDTEYDSVLICETDPYTIQLKADTDNNGTFETVLDTTPQPLKNTSKLLESTIVKGTSATVRAASVGGTGTSITFTPKHTDTYNISVKVRDSEGTIVKKSLTVQVTA